MTETEEIMQIVCPGCIYCRKRGYGCSIYVHATIDRNKKKCYYKEVE